MKKSFRPSQSFDEDSGSRQPPEEARRTAPSVSLSLEGKPIWWADVLTGRVRRDWEMMDNGTPRELWARR